MVGIYTLPVRAHTKEKMDRSKFFYGHFSKAEINQMCKSGMGSPKSSPTSSPGLKRQSIEFDNNQNEKNCKKLDKPKQSFNSALSIELINGVIYLLAVWRIVYICKHNPRRIKTSKFDEDDYLINGIVFGPVVNDIYFLVVGLFYSLVKVWGQ